jgi:hypothetical protein
MARTTGVAVQAIDNLVSAKSGSSERGLPIAAH